jgi:hypothetical protein
MGNNMRWHAKSTGILAAAAALGSVMLMASPAGAATSAAAAHAKTAASSTAPPSSVTLTPLDGKAATAAVDPDCTLSFIPGNGNAHISTFLQTNHKIRAVKVNAQISCRRVSTSLILRVTLWKTGAIFPHVVAGPTQQNLAKGNLIKNQKTWKECKNNTTTTYYGTAYGQVTFQGVVYSNSVQTRAKVPLACGT